MRTCVCVCVVCVCVCVCVCGRVWVWVCVCCGQAALCSTNPLLMLASSCFPLLASPVPMSLPLLSPLSCSAQGLAQPSHFHFAACTCHCVCAYVCVGVGASVRGIQGKNMLYTLTHDWVDAHSHLSPAPRFGFRSGRLHQSRSSVANAPVPVAATVPRRRLCVLM